MDAGVVFGIRDPDNFALVHHQRLGPMYVRLDELDALIAEARAARSGNAEDLRRAYEARSVLEPMPDLASFFGETEGADGEAPSLTLEAPERIRLVQDRAEAESFTTYI